MSNSLTRLLELQKAAAAAKNQASAESANSPSPEPPVEKVAEQGPAAPSDSAVQRPTQATGGNSLAGLLALQKKSAGVTPPPEPLTSADSPAQTPTTVIPPDVATESVPAPIDLANKPYPSMESIANMDEKGLAEVDLSQAIRLDLDRLDMLMTRDTGINAFNIDDCRGLIMRIMPELKKNPIYAGLVIDRDVHNIMTFCLATQQVAVIENTTKKSKEVKAKGKAAVKSAMGAALAKMSIPGIDDMNL